MDADDEFGGDEFLMNVDLDAMVTAAENSITNSNDSTKQSSTDKMAPTNSPAAKKRKISLSPTSAPTAAISEEELTKTLTKYYGYPNFRPGQFSVIQDVIQNQRDTGVFWATSAGKSICYQIPSLATGKVTVVVSPLISLMKDQVNKLNALSTNGKPLATFLGSAQSDYSQERAAFQGKFLLIYMTPEKLVSSLGELTQLHTTKREIGLFAIDEAHCVSEWGVDFRPEFLKIGEVLRGDSSRVNQELSKIPIMALTATAVPRVQAHLCRSLKLRQPSLSRQSFDRPNLIISVHKKDRSNMALASALEPLVASLAAATQRRDHQQQSTIIYAPTRNAVDDILSFLKQRLQGKSNIQVEAYHAGMSLAERNQAHTNFLTGKTTVICATIAFGMGIDKPDTRRVIHFGPPKTFEEYTQQIGRAGRDGIKAECIMYVTESDFDRYKSDFYLGGLAGRSKDAVLESLAALKSYALDGTTCRRKALLDFFKEKPSFGDRCGTCDTCRHQQKFEGDLERDFGPLGARIVLQAVEALDEPAASAIMKCIAGKNGNRYRFGIVEFLMKEKICSMKDSLKRKLTPDEYKELLVPLTQKGFIKEGSKSASFQGYGRTWTTYTITSKGRSALFNSETPIMLPVTESIREAERKEQVRREKTLAQLKESGVQIDKLPQDEIAAGDGMVIRAYSKLNGYLESLRRNGKEGRVSQIEELLESLEKWRAETAIKYSMAPGSVLAEYTLLTLAYAAATLPKGVKMEEPALLAAGVRTREMSALLDVLGEWADRNQPASQSSCAATCVTQPSAQIMKLIPGEIVTPKSAWEFAVYKPNKKTGLASWESSYNRFFEGNSPQSIALSPVNGRPIQVRTVCNHIMQALLYGNRGVDLHRLAQFLTPPNSIEWEQLQAAEISTGMDVCGNPVTSGVGGSAFKKTDFLRPIMGDSFTDSLSDERDETAKEKFGMWCNLLDWYMTLRRICYTPIFVER